MDFNPANQQLLQLYGKCYHSLNDTMLLDMIKPQIQNKMYYDAIVFTDIFAQRCKVEIFEIYTIFMVI